MTRVLVNHKVSDYPTWKKVFDNFVDTRKAGGEKSFSIMHPTDDPNNLILLFDWDSMDNAKKFFASPELKSAMERAGVAEAPTFNYLQEEDSGKL
jgi:quinol monooxygenase YgiN